MLAKLCLIYILLVVQETNSYNWKKDRRPKIMGERIPMKAITTNRRIIQKRIVQIHNYFRTRVKPKAANMLRMRWHDGAAKGALKWSQNCLVLIHDNITGRYVDNYGACGQNIFIATEKVPWLFAIKTWFLEKNNFTYGNSNNNLNLIGHYTQMVWATTHEIGCGLSKCYLPNSNTTFYNYICNYCPIGNRPGQLGRPYRRGKPCRFCPKNCYAQKLCLNFCPYADLWVNCRELFKVWPDWLCFTKSEKGQDRAKHCQATCLCKNKLHD